MIGPSYAGGYTDFGPKGSKTYDRRPECEGCGPFRGRFLRATQVWVDLGAEQCPITVYVCRGCDEEE